MTKGIVFCPAKGEIALARCETYRDNGCSFCADCNVPDEIEEEQVRELVQRDRLPNLKDQNIRHRGHRYKPRRGVMEKMWEDAAAWRKLPPEKKYIELRKLLESGNSCGIKVEWTGDGPDPYEEVRGA